MRIRQLLRQRNGPETGAVLLIGVISGLLYLAVYYIQRAIFLNGRISEIPGVQIGVPADRTRLFWEFTGYGIATVALFALYLRLLLVCRRGRLHNSRARALALLFPVLFNVALLPGRPYFSTDIFSYMVQGYLGITPGRHPYMDRVRDAANTEVALKIIPWGWKPETHGVSPYGALWTRLEMAVARVTEEVSTQVLLYKSVIVAASLLSAALIWLILGWVRPQDQLLGTLIYLWNPMVIVEFAAEGHNDALMIVFVLLAILLAVRARPASAIVALMLGILTKYLPLIFLPAHLVYFWRTRRSWSQLALFLMLGFAAGLAITVLLYRSLWVGPATLQGVRGQGQPRFIASTPMTLWWYLQQSRSEMEAARWTSLIVSALFGIYLLIVSAGVRDAVSLLKACGSIALVYLLVASPSYWPWYAALPLALMALSPHDTFFWMSLVLTFCSRLVAPMSDITVNGFTSWAVEVWSTTAIGLLLPLLIFGFLSARQWWQRAEPAGPLAST